MSKEIRQIIQKLNTLGADEKAVLATVVDVRGSSYRLPGAKMLILESGAGIGTISGGCLEADVLERAKRVLQTGAAEVFTYDTTNDENSVFSLNMGCRGIVRILLEPIEKDSHFFEFLSVCLKRRKIGKVVTLINSNKTNLKIGSRIFQDELNFFANQLSFDEILEIKNLPENSPTIETLSFGEVFVETIKPPLSLLIFGAGADAIPLADIANNLGWQITVSDHRPAFLTKERFPQALKLVRSNTENYFDEISFDEQTAAVVMSHNYERDREILVRLLKSEVFYIGALGPKRRTEKLLQEIKEQGETFGGEQLKKLHAPVGLDIGADTPEAIALAIAAEIQAVLKEREGGFLRERQGSIYGRNE